MLVPGQNAGGGRAASRPASTATVTRCRFAISPRWERAGPAAGSRTPGVARLRSPRPVYDGLRALWGAPGDQVQGGDVPVLGSPLRQEVPGGPGKARTLE